MPDARRIVTDPNYVRYQRQVLMIVSLLYRLVANTFIDIPKFERLAEKMDKWLEIFYMLAHNIITKPQLKTLEDRLFSFLENIESLHDFLHERRSLDGPPGQDDRLDIFKQLEDLQTSFENLTALEPSLWPPLPLHSPTGNDDEHIVPPQVQNGLPAIDGDSEPTRDAAPAADDKPADGSTDDDDMLLDSDIDKRNTHPDPRFTPTPISSIEDSDVTMSDDNNDNTPAEVKAELVSNYNQAQPSTIAELSRGSGPELKQVAQQGSDEIADRKNDSEDDSDITYLQTRPVGEGYDESDMATLSTEAHIDEVSAHDDQVNDELETMTDAPTGIVSAAARISPNGLPLATEALAYGLAVCGQKRGFSNILDDDDVFDDCKVAAKHNAQSSPHAARIGSARTAWNTSPIGRRCWRHRIRAAQSPWTPCAYCHLNGIEREKYRRARHRQTSPLVDQASTIIRPPKSFGFTATSPTLDVPVTAPQVTRQVIQAFPVVEALSPVSSHTLPAYEPTLLTLEPTSDARAPSSDVTVGREASPQVDEPLPTTASAGLPEYTPTSPTYEPSFQEYLLGLFNVDGVRSASPQANEPLPSIESPQSPTFTPSSATFEPNTEENFAQAPDAVGARLAYPEIDENLSPLATRPPTHSPTSPTVGRFPLTDIHHGNDESAGEATAPPRSTSSPLRPGSLGSDKPLWRPDMTPVPRAPDRNAIGPVDAPFQAAGPSSSAGRSSPSAGPDPSSAYGSPCSILPNLNRPFSLGFSPDPPEVWSPEPIGDDTAITISDVEIRPLDPSDAPGPSSPRRVGTVLSDFGVSSLSSPDSNASANTQPQRILNEIADGLQAINELERRESELRRSYWTSLAASLENASSSVIAGRETSPEEDLPDYVSDSHSVNTGMENHAPALQRSRPSSTGVMDEDETITMHSSSGHSSDTESDRENCSPPSDPSPYSSSSESGSDDENDSDKENIPRPGYVPRRAPRTVNVHQGIRLAHDSDPDSDNENVARTADTPRRPLSDIRGRRLLCQTIESDTDGRGSDNSGTARSATPHADPTSGPPAFPKRTADDAFGAEEQEGQGRNVAARHSEEQSPRGTHNRNSGDAVAGAGAHPAAARAIGDHFVFDLWEVLFDPRSPAPEQPQQVAAPPAYRTFEKDRSDIEQAYLSAPRDIASTQPAGQRATQLGHDQATFDGPPPMGYTFLIRELGDAFNEGYYGGLRARVPGQDPVVDAAQALFGVNDGYEGDDEDNEDGDQDGDQDRDNTRSQADHEAASESGPEHKSQRHSGLTPDDAISISSDSDEDDDPPSPVASLSSASSARRAGILTPHSPPSAAEDSQEPNYKYTEHASSAGDVGVYRHTARMSMRSQDPRCPHGARRQTLQRPDIWDDSDPRLFRQ
ncbi:hypothetical protein BDW74DRAFT_178081 [Aspergillus multicolor]|uniref:uncharacterized protein n=1 Tax=Aspergillus multicolor TaxID=41759 RepID=UPI003CCDF0DC